MSKTKKSAIITILIVGSLLVIFHNYLDYFSYKSKAEKYVINKFKKDYKINVKVKKVVVGTHYNEFITPFNPVCKVIVEYQGKEYIVLVNTFQSKNNVYDDYQKNEIRNGFINYINSELNNKAIESELYYSASQILKIPYNLECTDKNMTNIYYDGSNYKDIFINDASGKLIYNNINIKDDKIKEVFKEYSNEFKFYIEINNEEAEKSNVTLNDVTCIKNTYFNNSHEFKKIYRRDFGKIKAYGPKKLLSNMNATITNPIDLTSSDKYDSNKYKIVSNYYRISCNYVEESNNTSENTIEIHIPEKIDKEKEYTLFSKYAESSENNKIEIDDYVFTDDEGYIKIDKKCDTDKAIDYVIAEKLYDDNNQ